MRAVVDQHHQTLFMQLGQGLADIAKGGGRFGQRLHALPPVYKNQHRSQARRNPPRAGCDLIHADRCLGQNPIVTHYLASYCV